MESVRFRFSLQECNMSISKWMMAIVVGLGMITAGHAHAATYPSKDVRIVCWSAAGASLDVTARTLATELEKVWGETTIVENRVGGSGAVAMAYAMSQPADGYVLLTTTSSLSFTVAKGTIPFKVEDFIMLRAVEAEPSALAVRKDSPLKTLDDFVKTMKSTSGSLRVGGYASAGFHQFTYYKLQQLGGFSGHWVPFDGGNQAVAALLGGHLDAAIITPSSALAQIESGDIRILGISTAERSPFFPQAPTMAEQGYDIVEYLWRGLMVKKGTPKETIDIINAAIDKAVSGEKWQAYMKNRCLEKVSYASEELTKKTIDEVSERKAFLKDIGLIR